MRRAWLGRSLATKVLAAEVAIILAGSATLAVAALVAGPPLFRRHVRDALGFVPEGVSGHLDDAFGQALWLSLALGVAAATVTAALVGWLVAARIVRPVRSLAAAAEGVAGGDYAVRVPVDGSDEIAILGRAFNEMATSLGSAEERRRRLLSDVAHELRTPLATLDAYLEGLADGVVEPAPATWTLLRVETGRLARLAEDISSVSRAEERQLDLRPERVAAGTLLEDASCAAAPGFQAKGVALEMLPSSGSPAVVVDRQRLAEVLANLLENALRHTPPDGRVTLSAAVDGADAVLTVADTGTGIATDELERIFERFYRVDASRARDRGGSGIGLTISRALVEAQSGSLRAESDGPGRGARFVLRLPAA